MIFYFTATGNCRFVADQLAEKLGDEVRSIPQEMRRRASFRMRARPSVSCIPSTGI